MTNQALSVRNLVKTYANGVEAVKGIDFEVAPGQAFALIGANGAGKSTTIGMITTLIQITAGVIHIFDHDLAIEPEKAKAQVGVVPQEPNFSVFETLLQNLIKQAGFYGVTYTTACTRAEYYLKKLDLWTKRNNMIRELSGGMKRRLMLARALMHQPKFLILDEPTAGIDTEMRQFTLDFIEELKKSGTTILLTTHYLEEAERLCDNVAIIHQGNIVEQGSMQDLLKQLKQETIVLYLKEAMTNTSALNGFQYQQLAPDRVEVELNMQQSMNALFEQLNHHKITVTGIKNKANRLETLFLNTITEQKASHV